MQEQAIEHKYSAFGTALDRLVHGLISGDVVHGGAVAAASTGQQGVEQCSPQPVVVEGVQPESDW